VFVRMNTTKPQPFFLFQTEQQKKKNDKANPALRHYLLIQGLSRQ
jgi:hypothetical protein